MTKVKTTNPDLIIEEEEDGSITVEGWADDIETHKEQIKTLVRKTEENRRPKTKQ